MSFLLCYQQFVKQLIVLLHYQEELWSLTPPGGCCGTDFVFIICVHKNICLYYVYLYFYTFNIHWFYFRFFGGCITPCSEPLAVMSLPVALKILLLSCSGSSFSPIWSEVWRRANPTWKSFNPNPLPLTLPWLRWGHMTRPKSAWSFGRGEVKRWSARELKTGQNERVAWTRGGQTFLKCGATVGSLV